MSFFSQECNKNSKTKTYSLNLTYLLLSLIANRQIIKKGNYTYLCTKGNLRVSYLHECSLYVTTNPSWPICIDEMIPPLPEQSSILIQTLSAPPAEPHDSGMVRQECADRFPRFTDWYCEWSVRMALLNLNNTCVRWRVWFKEQSPCQRVLLSQTMPEGYRPRALSETTKPKGKGIVPIITQHM